MNKIHKVILYYIGGLLLITVVWNIAFHAVLLPKYFIKTEAKVTDVHTKHPTTYRGGRQVTQLPVYEYRDDKGELHTFESQDGFNVINGFLLKKEVGQTVTAYYEKGYPDSLFITGTGDWYTFLLAPIIIGIFPLGLVVVAVLYFLHKRSKLA